MKLNVGLVRTIGGLTITRRSELEFQLWWEKNKVIPYNSKYYELACYVWDKYESEI